MISPPAAPAAGRRRRITARTRLDFWFDAVLLLGFALAYSYGFTGIAIHEWLGIGLGAALPRALPADRVVLDRAPFPDSGRHARTGAAARCAALEVDRQGRAQVAGRAVDPAARVRFLRHLAAVLLVVAAVVLLAVAWNHAAGGTLGMAHPGHDVPALVPGQHGARALIPGQHGGSAPAAGHVVRPGRLHGLVIVRLSPMDLGLTSMFNPVNLPSLRHAVVIETAVGAAVVIIDFIRRRWRRARRAGS